MKNVYVYNTKKINSNPLQNKKLVNNYNLHISLICKFQLSSKQYIY